MAKKRLQIEKGGTSGQSHETRLARLRNKDSRPNILILMTDQQRYDTLQVTGASHMRTPNLDRLAAGGCLYRNAYSPNPICMPVRHNMLTGLTARVHGYPDNNWGFGMPSAIPTFPRLLSDSLYNTCTIGKNHFFPPRRHHGYERMKLMSEVPAFREQDDYAMYLKDHGLGHIHAVHGIRHLLYMLPQRSLIPVEHHGTTWAADQAVDFIRANGGRQPFLLKVSWIAPHPPFDVPDEYADLYRDSRFPGPLESETSVSPLAEENKLLGDLPNSQYTRRMRELYYSAVTMVDDNVGRIISALEDTGQLDNTLILFLTDHGEMLGDYGTYQKWLPYNACAKIPFILRYPARIDPGSVCDEFVDLNDVFPTILDAAEVEYPGGADLPGESLLTENQRKDRNVQYIEYSAGNRRWVSLLNKDYKYTYYYGGGREELFCLRDDPGETLNLMESGLDSEAKDARSDLRQRLVTFEDEWGLKGYVDDGDFIVLDPFEPKPYRNRAFPVFHEKIMDPDERRGMNSLFDEIIMAVEREPLVSLQDLDLEAWQKNGDFSGKDMADLLAREKSMRQGS